ncbi:MAG: hypothetical protein HQ488_04540 [Parcubacteria group bacterium]|nr:hypothetical protein [Parcubacteria group bacterium]
MGDEITEVPPEIQRVACLAMTPEGQVVFDHTGDRAELRLVQGQLWAMETAEECAQRRLTTSLFVRSGSEMSLHNLGLISLGSESQRTQMVLFVATGVDLRKEGMRSMDGLQENDEPVLLSLYEIYKQIREGAISDTLVQTAVMRMLVTGLINPPGVLPLARFTPVHSITHHWFSSFMGHGMTLTVMSDGRIRLYDGSDDFCSMPPSVFGVLATDLKPIIRRLKRQSRRKSGVWSFRLYFYHGYTYDYAAKRDRGGNGPHLTLYYEVKELENARALAIKFQEILDAQAKLPQLNRLWFF